VVLPVVGIGNLGSQFQIGNVLANGAAQLVTEGQAGEWATIAMPLLSPSLEADVLSENNSAKFLSALE
jgi:hypothetical protein